jgi:hypothetical protein
MRLLLLVERPRTARGAILMQAARTGLANALAALVMLAASLESAAWVGMLLPVMRWEIRQLAPHLRVVDLRTTRAQAEEVLVLTVTLAAPVSVGGRWFQPHPAGRANASTPLGHAAQPVLVITAALLIAALRERECPLLRIPIGYGFAVVLVCLDMPIALVGALQEMMAGAAAVSVTLLGRTAALFDGGGRLALSLACAAAIIFAPARQRSGHQPP